MGSLHSLMPRTHAPPPWPARAHFPYSLVQNRLLARIPFRFPRRTSYRCSICLVHCHCPCRCPLRSTNRVPEAGPNGHLVQVNERRAFFDRGLDRHDLTLFSRPEAPQSSKADQNKSRPASAQATMVEQEKCECRSAPSLDDTSRLEAETVTDAPTTAIRLPASAAYCVATAYLALTTNPPTYRLRCDSGGLSTPACTSDTTTTQEPMRSNPTTTPDGRGSLVPIPQLVTASKQAEKLHMTTDNIIFESAACQIQKVFKLRDSTY